MKRYEALNPGVVAKITEYYEDPASAVKAKASICVGHSIYINDLKLLNGKNGLYVSMPMHLSKDKKGNPRFVMSAYPTTGIMRRAIREAVLDAYYKEQKRRKVRIIKKWSDKKDAA